MSWFHSSSSVKLAEKLTLAERNLEAVVEQLQTVEEGHAEEIRSLRSKNDALMGQKLQLIRAPMISAPALTLQSEEVVKRMEELFAVRLQKEVDAAYARGKGEASTMFEDATASELFAEAFAATECEIAAPPARPSWLLRLDRAGIAPVEAAVQSQESEEFATLRDEYEALELAARKQHAEEVALLRATVTELEIELARYEHREPSHTRTLVVDEGGAETALSETEEDAEAVVERLLAGNAPALPVLKPVPTRLSLPAPEPEPEPAPEPEPKPAPPPSPEPELASAPEPEPAPPPEATPLLAGARSLAAAALHAAAEMQAQVRALEQTPEPEPQPAPEPAPEPAPAPVLPPASVTAPFQITVRRGSRGLGLRVNSSNIITELTAGGQAAQEGQLAVGDLVVAVDGVPMYDVTKGIRPLKEVLSDMPVKDGHRFSIRRANHLRSKPGEEVERV